MYKKILSSTISETYKRIFHVIKIISLSLDYILNSQKYTSWAVINMNYSSVYWTGKRFEVNDMTVIKYRNEWLIIKFKMHRVLELFSISTVRRQVLIVGSTSEDSASKSTCRSSKSTPTCQQHKISFVCMICTFKITVKRCDFIFSDKKESLFVHATGFFSRTFS